MNEQSGYKLDRRDVLAMGVAAAVLGESTSLADGNSDPVIAHQDRLLLQYRLTPVNSPPGVDPLQTRNGYLHPVMAPNGAVVTDDMNPDHLHQRGVFSAWTRAEVTVDGRLLKPDFWNLGSGLGRVRAVSAKQRERGIDAHHVFEARRDDGWVAVLDDRWEVRLAHLPEDPAAPDAALVFDITSRQTPRYDLTLPRYHYGGMAVRGSKFWPKGSDVRVLTSEGKDRIPADSQPARWVDLSGTIGDKVAGIALLEHPRCPHAPNRVRVHPDMPYYVFALPQAGPLTLKAGEDVFFRYRVVAHNGWPDTKQLAALWDELAATPLR